MNPTYNPERKTPTSSWLSGFSDFGHAIYRYIHHGFLVSKEDSDYWGQENMDEDGSKVIKWPEHGEMREKEITLNSSDHTDHDRCEFH